MAEYDFEIPEHAIRHGVAKTSFELHLTGGIRARREGQKRWIWYPVLVEGVVRQLTSQPIEQIDNTANNVGLKLFGGDEQSIIEPSLISRVWTPLDGPNNGEVQPADRWNAISFNAEKAGDNVYAALAENISFSLIAAGIRLRDASDSYRDQLMTAIHHKQKPGHRSSNIPKFDIHIAFHSVLSELASARDYLAALLASRLHAPERIDAMNRFADWLSVTSRADLRAQPVIAEMLASYDPTAPDPWLFQLTEYRNLFLHRKPIGASNATGFLMYNETQREEIVFPSISLPLGDEDPSAPGKDALTRFVELYRAMMKLMKQAASYAPYSSTPPSFVIR